MQCPECAGDVPVLREFCPHCGAPTDPGLRARQREPRGDRSGEELRGNRKKVLIGGAAILAVLAVMGKISLPGPDIRIDTDRDGDRKGPVVIQAQQLSDAYREDEDAADRRFDDREMVVSGEIRSCWSRSRATAASSGAVLSTRDIRHPPGDDRPAGRRVGELPCPSHVSGRRSR